VEVSSALRVGAHDSWDACARRLVPADMSIFFSIMERGLVLT
jgi:hypothetical protein